MVEGSIAQFGRFHAWVATVSTCLIQREKCGGHTQEVHGDTFTSHVKETIGHLIGQIRMFVLIWKPGELVSWSEITGNDTKRTENRKF